MNSMLSKIMYFLASVFMFVSVAMPSQVRADDTEIFFGQGQLANMVFALDTSGSMTGYADNKNGKANEWLSKRFRIYSSTRISHNSIQKHLPSVEKNPKARFAVLIGGYRTSYSAQSISPNWQGGDGIYTENRMSKSYVSAGYYRWLYLDNRMSRLKVALHSFLTSEKTGDNVMVGLLGFSGGSYKDLSQTRRLDKVTGGKTHRQHLIDTITTLEPGGNTPTALAYYEATKKIASAYTQIGSATPGSECGFSNALVLLTDGQPTSFSGDTRKKIKKIAGACKSGDNGKDCTIKLSKHYFTNDVKKNFPGSTINTTTVAFALKDKDARKFLRKTASEVDGKRLAYTPSSIDELVRSFDEALNGVRKATSFVAPSVPLSQSNRLQHSNNLYMAMFQPAAQETWSGNLKKYSLVDGIIVDSNGKQAVNVQSGTFKDTAVSHWFKADSDNSADGNNISLGGAMPKVSVGDSAKVYINMNSNDLERLSPEYIDRWMSSTGVDVQDKLFGLNKKAGEAEISKADLRSYYNWVSNRLVDEAKKLNRFGDALHSRPFVVEYNNENVVYVTTNQGYLHAINPETGVEKWAFFPRQLLKNVPAWLKNEAFPDHTSLDRNYGLDGQIHVHSFQDSDGNQKHHLYIGMRRGGNNIYALDVSNPNAPKMLYTISDKFRLKRSELGYNGEKRLRLSNGLAQSWTMPAIVKVPADNDDGYAKRLIFSGGYDTYYDSKANNINPASNTIKGNALYSVPFYETTSVIPNNISATKLVSSDVIKNSIAANMTFVDTDNNGIVNSAYASDVGGKVYRFDFTKSGVTTDVLADMGTDSDGSYRFYSKPDVVFASHKGKSFAVVALGTGHRPNPKYATSIDKFYAFFDTEITKLSTANDDDPILPGALYDVTNGKVDEEGGDTQFASIDSIISSSKKGWYIKLALGEKVLGNSTTLDFNTFFTTFNPAQGNNCGITSSVNRLYGVDLLSGAPSVRYFYSGSVVDPTDRYYNVNYLGIAPGVSILFPSDTEIATLVGTQTICTGDDCDFYKGGVRTVKWKQKK